MQNSGKGYSIAGLVLGIVAIVFSWVPGFNFVALVAGIIGIVCAVTGRKYAMAFGAPTGLGTAGLALSIVGTCFAGIGFLTCTVCASCGSGICAEAIDELYDELFW